MLSAAEHCSCDSSLTSSSFGNELLCARRCVCVGLLMEHGRRRQIAATPRQNPDVSRLQLNEMFGGGRSPLPYTSPSVSGNNMCESPKEVRLDGLQKDKVQGLPPCAY